MIDPKEKLRRVELTPYKAIWTDLFEDAAKDITTILQENFIEIHHIGSTAIPGIYAKPIIDIMPVVKDIRLIDALNPEFEKLGFICMGEYGIKGRRFYWKSRALRTHNIHLFQQDSPEILRHIQFKNFLLTRPDIANAYSILKKCLAKAFIYDIENYVNGKSSFVQMIEYKAGVAKQTQLDAPDHVDIQPYNPAWPKLASAEMNAIALIASGLPYQSMYHLGSTAVPSLASKPVVDLLISIPSIIEATHWITPLELLGYSFWKENTDKTQLRFFKGMPPFGTARTHHVNIVASSNPILEQKILFRNILIKHANVRIEYEQLKLKLSQQYAYDREGYTESKTDFIRNILKIYGHLNYFDS